MSRELHALEVKAGRGGRASRAKQPRDEFTVSPAPGGAPVQATRAKGRGQWRHNGAAVRYVFDSENNLSRGKRSGRR